MNIYVVTAFPDMIKSCVGESMFKKAATKAGVNYNIWNLRDFTKDKHRQIDDTPYGGGAGMVLKPEPFFRAYDKLTDELNNAKQRIIFPSPQGKTFDHETAVTLSKEKNLVFFCGHYKGVDERVIEELVTDEISIGDFVLTGGELPSLMMIDAIIRHIPGVLHTYESAQTDSFADELLEGPIYTKPDVYRNLKVPEILFSGHHANIADWRFEQRLKRTKERRKDLLKEKTKKTINDLGGNNG